MLYSCTHMATVGFKGLIQRNITVPHNSGISSELNIKCHLILLLKVNCKNFRTLLVYSSEKTRMIGLAGGKGILTQYPNVTNGIYTSILPHAIISNLWWITEYDIRPARTRTKGYCI